jgi:amidase
MRSTAWLASLLSLALVQAQGRTFDLLTAGVADIQAAVDAGALTYERLVGLYLNRIQAYDKQGPQLRAVLTINPRAIEIARALDEERRTKGRRGPLHGIPIAVKDNLDTTDLPTTGGNVVFEGSFPARDATVVQRLRQAGAILLVKTNMDELAMASRGFSTLGGQILNPYDLARDPGGSSGGTAVAVTAGFATLGIATETGFSIRSPATNSSIVGIAPTRGLVSRAGVIPISFTQDRVGPHAKSVVDAALLLDVLRGFDEDDLMTTESLGRVPATSFAEITADGMRGIRIGVLRDLFRIGAQFEPINKLIEAQIAVMRAQGAEVTDPVTTGSDVVAMMPTLRVNSYEVKPAFDGYLRRRGAASPVKTFADLVATGRWLKGGTLETRFVETMKAGDLNVNAAYLATLQNQRRLRQSLVELMDRQQLDALVYPVKSLSAPPIGSADDGPRDNNVSSTTGLPAVVVPAGLNAEGLPFSIEILGRPFGDARLIQIAHAYERASRARVAPKSTPHLPGDVFSY